MITTVGTDTTTVDMTMDLPEGGHMTDPHHEITMTTWIDALVAETIMVMVVAHTEAGVLPRGAAKIRVIVLCDCCT